MLYVFTGGDSNRRNKAVSKLLLSLESSGAHIIKRDDTSSRVIEIRELVGSSTLFAEPIALLLSETFTNDEILSFVTKEAGMIAKSENHIIIVERALTADTKKKLEKHATSFEIFEEKKEKKTEGNNAFDLTDALGDRDKKKVWMLYRRAIEDGKDPRELIGLVFWSVKSMIIAELSPSVSDSGLNPFVYKKSKSFAKNFTKDELNNLAKNIVNFYHEAQFGKVEWEEGMEVLLLEACEKSLTK